MSRWRPVRDCAPRSTRDLPRAPDAIAWPPAQRNALDDFYFEPLPRRAIGMDRAVVGTGHRAFAVNRMKFSIAECSWVDIMQMRGITCLRRYACVLLATCC